MQMLVPGINYENPLLVNLNEEFRIKAGQHVNIQDENLKITFISVVGDSRSPIGMERFAEGNAEILLIFYHNGEEREIVLNTNFQPKSVSFKDYQITLKQLNPYPVQQKIIFNGCYTATLTVRRMRIYS